MKSLPFRRLVHIIRHRASFPQSSIIAAEELNFCVRNENRCFLLAMGTEVRFPRLATPLLRQCGRNLASMTKKLWARGMNFLIDRCCYTPITS